MMPSSVLKLVKRQGKVTRSNALARSRHQLGLMQNRIMYLLFSKIQRNDATLLVQQIPITEIRDKLRGHYGSFYDELREAVTDLVSQNLYIEKENGGWKVMSWLTSAEYVRSGERTETYDFLEIKLHEDLIPHLLQLKEKYNSIPLDALLALTSANSQRLIDILWHDSFAGERRDLEYEIEDLKVRMNLGGKYDRFRDFTRLLDRVQTEFLDKTPLRFTYEGLKAGRAWSRIRFEIWFEQTDATSQAAMDPNDPVLKRRAVLTRALHEAGYIQNVDATLDAHGLDVVEEVLKQAQAAERRSARSSTPIHNLGGLIHSMLKAGVGKRPAHQKALKRVNPRELASSIVTSYMDARARHADKVWGGLDEPTQLGIHDLMKATLSDFLLQQVKKANWCGLIYEKARNDVLEKSDYLSYPVDLSDVRDYIRNSDLLKDLPDEQHPAVIHEASQLTAGS